jgi:2-keto-3-deoxy-L-rhamnonate aldolase RhmA
MNNAFRIENPAKRRLASGGFVLAMALRHSTATDTPMMVHAAGFDTFYLDCEHGTYSRDDASRLCTVGQALGMTPLVRVATHDAGGIAAALDGGALGLLVPHVDTPAQAEAVVAHAKYPPAGGRGVSAQGPTTRYRPIPLADSLRQQNEETLIVLMLETGLAIENARAIAAVAGVDALMLGPTDLSTDLGISGDIHHDRIRDAYLKVAAACRARGKHLVSGSAGDLDVRQQVDLGARILMGGSDSDYFLAAARSGAAELRAATGC